MKAKIGNKPAYNKKVADDACCFAIVLCPEIVNWFHKI
jgi:hypothetical protein